MIDTTFHNVTEQGELLEKLTALGIPVTEVYGDVIAAGKRMDRLTSYASRFNRDSSHSLEELTRQIARDPGDYQGTIASVLGAALSGSEDVRKKVFDVFSRAEDMAAGDYLRAFRKKAPTTIDLLAERYDELVVDAARANAIDIGIQNLETAARAGVADRWLALERAESNHKAISRILTDLTKKKVLTAGVAWRAPEKLTAVPRPAKGAGGVYLAAAVKAGANPGVISGEEWKRWQRDRNTQDEIERRREARTRQIEGEAARAETEQHVRREHLIG